MARCYGDPIPLVPGDDVALTVATLDQNGDELDFSAWTVTFAKVEWAVTVGEVTTIVGFDVTADVSTPGVVVVTASEADTALMRSAKLTIVPPAAGRPPSRSGATGAVSARGFAGS